MARVVDSVARELFAGEWVGVAVEMFIMNTPRPGNEGPQAERRAPSDWMKGASGPSAAETSTEPDDYCSMAVDGAEWHLSRAWDLLDALGDEASKTKAERVRNLGIAQIGESRVREAMVEARVERFRRMERMGQRDVFE